MPRPPRPASQHIPCMATSGVSVDKSQHQDPGRSWLVSPGIAGTGTAPGL